LINWWKKWIDFVKIRLHLNENIDDIAWNLNWTSIETQLNWIWFRLTWMEFQFNSIQIQFKINDMQVGGESIVNILLNVALGKINF
jgi:hypothetical protein